MTNASSSLTLSFTHHQPLSPPPQNTHSLTRPLQQASPCHVASMHVRSLSISFSRAPLISQRSRMWAERAASPTLKITTSVWQGWGGAWKGGVQVWGWEAVVVLGWGGYSQLTGIRFNCSYSTEGRSDGERCIFSANPWQKMLSTCHSKSKNSFPLSLWGLLVAEVF